MNTTLSANIEGMDINTKLSLTPFDVIAGIPESSAYNVTNNLRGNINRFNREHLNMENNIIFPVGNDPDFFGSHMSCPNYSDDNSPNRVRILNREIGDDILWLENMNLNRIALYESEYDIHVNVRNPYYEYSSQPNLDNDYIQDGFYSKQGLFDILDNGEATLKYDEVNSPTGIGLNYQPPSSGTYNELNAPLFICCLNYNENYYRLRGKEEPPKTNELIVYPNPSNANEITIQIKFAEGKDIHLRIFDLYGRLIFDRIIPYNKNHLEKKIEVDLSSLQLASGTYIIIGSNSGGQAYQKLVIQNQ